MAISSNDIKIKYVIDDSELRKAASSFDKLTQEEQDAIAGMKKLNTELGNTGKKATETGDKLSNAFDKGKEGVGGLSKSLGGLGPAIVGAFSVTAVLGFAKAVFDTTANFEKMASVLKNQLGSGSQASIVLEQIKEFAKTTPFSVQELTDSFIKLNGAGVRPSIEQMRKLGDVASSQGKSFIQLSEAILDARNFEFERLKELNINTRTVGDNLIFTFNNVQTTVKKNKEAVTEYIYSLGEFNGVAGASAAVSETLGGKVNNLGDAWDNFLNSIGTLLKPVLTGALQVTADFMDGINKLFKLGTTGAQDVEQAELNAFKSFQSKTATMTDQMLEDRAKKNSEAIKQFEKEAAALEKSIGSAPSIAGFDPRFEERQKLQAILEQLAVYKGENAAINEQIKLRNDNTAKTVKVYAEFNAEQKKAADEQAKADKKEYEEKLKILELEKQQRILLGDLYNDPLAKAGAEKAFQEDKLRLQKEYAEKGVKITETEIETTNKARLNAEHEFNQQAKDLRMENYKDIVKTEEEIRKERAKTMQQGVNDAIEANNKIMANNAEMLRIIKKDEDEKVDIKLKAIELTQTITDGVFGIYQANLNNEMNLLNKRYQEEVRLADGNKQRLTEIEQEKAAKEKEIKTKQFQAEQAAAVARVIFETASQVAKWASSPVTAPLAALTLAVQAAQIGFILAQPVPEFAEGTKGKPFKGGKAMVGERGVEKVITESGKVYFTPPTATLVDLPKGSQVIPNHALSKQEIYWGSMQSSKQAGSGSPMIGKLDELGSILKGLPITQLNMDERGFEKFIRTPRRTTKILNNRFRTEN